MSTETSNQSKRILGIDPGLGRVGWGVIDISLQGRTGLAYGCIETDKDLPTAKRLEQIHAEISEVVSEFKPDRVVIERLFFARNITTAMNVSEARGVIMLVLAKNNIPYTEQSPRQLKTAIAGYGDADKKQMQYMVQHLLELDKIPKPDDAADGLALALSVNHLDPSLYEPLKVELS